MGTPRWWAPVLGISLCDELSWLLAAARWPLAAAGCCWLLLGLLAAGVAWHGAARHDGMDQEELGAEPVPGAPRGQDARP